MVDRTKVEIQGLDGVLELLKTLPKEVVSKRGGPVRKSLRAGARVILNQAKTNLKGSLSRATKSVYPDGSQVPASYSTGLAERSLGIGVGKKPSWIRAENVEVVNIRPKSTKYPGVKRRKGRAMTTYDTLWMLEFGTSKQIAEPWIRPAYSAKANEAISVISTTLVDDIQKIVKRLQKG